MLAQQMGDTFHSFRWDKFSKMSQVHAGPLGAKLGEGLPQALKRERIFTDLWHE